ncbi:hypothetical protein KDK95_25985, partial [Actinospica sp. MGRD01-02]
VWVGAAVVVAAPEAIVAAAGGALLQTDVILAVGCAMLVGYFVATVAFGPDLATWRYRAWLFAKVAATTLAGIGVAAIAVAGVFGFVVALPIAGVAAVSAVGTALLRRGIRGGSIVVIGTFLVVGDVIGRYHFQLASDDRIVRVAAISAFSIAAISAALWALSVVRERE